MSEEKYTTNNIQETKDLGKNLANRLKGGAFIALYGDLGSGKTTFVQGFAQGLGIKRRIISPTFIIVRHYKIKLKTQNSKLKSTTQDLKSLYHIDLYRINSTSDLATLGIDEIIREKSNIIVVEWAEKMEETMPKDRINIYFKYLSENKREISIKKVNHE